MASIWLAVNSVQCIVIIQKNTLHLPLLLITNFMKDQAAQGSIKNIFEENYLKFLALIIVFSFISVFLATFLVNTRIQKETLAYPPIPPQIAIRQPTEGSVLSGIVQVNLVFLEENNFSTIDLFVDNSFYSRTKSVDVKEPSKDLKIPVDTRKFKDGEHTIVVRAIDESKKEQTTSIKVLLSNAMAGEVSQ